MARPEEAQVDVGAVQVTPPMRERLYDYYVPPAKTEPSPLHALAAALAPISNDLFSIVAQQQAKQNDNDKAQGETDFWNKNSDGNAEAIRNGSLPTFKSKSYMDGYASQAGMNDALRLNQSIGPSYQSLDKTGTDEAAFDKWFMGQASERANPGLKSNASYARAYAAGIARLHSEFSSRFVTDRSNAIKEGAQQEFSAAIGNTVTSSVALAPDLQSTVDVNQLAGTLSAVRLQSIKAGLDKGYADKSTIDTVATQALLAKDPSVLEVLKAMPQDPLNQNSARLGETEYGQQKILETQNTIKSTGLADRARWKAEQDAADKEAVNTAQRGLLDKWAANPQYIPTAEENAPIQKVDPLWPTKLATIREGVLKGQEPIDDPQAVGDFIGRILQNGGTAKDIFDAKAAGVLNTQASLKQALEATDLIAKLNKGSGVQQVQEDAGFKQYISQIQGLTADPKWMQNVLGTPKVTPDGRRAINEFTLAAMKHAAENPTEGLIERRKFLNDLGETVIKGISNQDREDFHQHTYQTPQEVQQLLTQPGNTPQQPQGATGAAPAAAPVLPQPAAPGNAPAGSPGPSGSPAAPQGGGTLRDTLKSMPAAPKFEQLSPDQQQQLQGAAKQMGATPQQVLEEMWKRAQEAPGKQGALEPTQQTADAGGQAPLSFQVPGGGRVDVHGVNPEAGEHIKNMLALLGSGKGMSAAAAPVEHTGAAAQVDQNRVARIDALPVHTTIEKVAKEEGMDPGLAKAMVSIESGGRATATTGSYHGLLQLSRAEFQKYGDGGDIDNPEDNLRAGMRAIKAKSEAFSKEFGHDPSPTELYLMHQQGEAGLRSHERNPEAPAWQNMQATGEGRQKGAGWAKQAVWGNVPSDMRHLFGSVENITSAEFMAVWKHKLEGIPYTTALRDARSRSKLASTEE